MTKSMSYHGYMKKFKDFFYNVNDIFVAIIILGIAAFVIIWSMDNIMAYPSTLIETDKSKTTQRVPALWENGKLTKSVSVTISEGIASDAIKPLIKKKIFSDYEEFEKECKSAQVNVESLKLGDFTFEVGMTKADIVKRLTE